MLISSISSTALYDIIRTVKTNEKPKPIKKPERIYIDDVVLIPTSIKPEDNTLLIPDEDYILLSEELCANVFLHLNSYVNKGAYTYCKYDDKRLHTSYVKKFKKVIDHFFMLNDKYYVSYSINLLKGSLYLESNLVSEKSLDRISVRISLNNYTDYNFFSELGFVETNTVYKLRTLKEVEEMDTELEECNHGLEELEQKEIDEEFIRDDITIIDDYYSKSAISPVEDIKIEGVSDDVLEILKKYDKVNC